MLRPVMWTSPVVAMVSITSSGVRNTPSTLDRLEETMAPATLPCATEVKAMEDWTVPGTRVR